MDATKLVDWLKLAPRLLFAVSIGTGVIIFSSTDLARTLGVDGFRNDYRGWLGFAFIVSTAAWVSHGFAEGARGVQSFVREKFAMRRRRHYLQRLSEGEKEILRSLLQSDKKTVALDIHSGIHANLEALQVIYRTTTVRS